MFRRPSLDRNRGNLPYLPSLEITLALTNPRITWLILRSAGVGYFVGLRGVIFWDSSLVCFVWHTIIGTA